MTTATEVLRWALSHGISTAAFAELGVILSAATLPTEGTSPVKLMSEAATQQKVRFAGADAGWLLWRNNCGVAVDESGRHLRYGLCNDSQALNEKVKSSDLIGIRPLKITLDHVGAVVGQFVARECKRSDWSGPRTSRERAQSAFLDLVNLKGGDAKFTTGAL